MIDTILKLIAPHHCVACNRDGNVLCTGCAGNLTTLPSVCYRCGTAVKNYKVCDGCHKQTGLHSVFVRTKYVGAAKDALWKLKFSGARAAAVDIAHAILAEYAVPESAVIVHVPTATSRVRTRGYDQAALIARRMARGSNAVYLPCLARHGQHRQVGATRAERMRHLQDAYRIRNGYNVQGEHIVLVDDVLTTGATLEAAAKVLKRAGAKRVDAVVFARA